MLNIFRCGLFGVLAFITSSASFAKENQTEGLQCRDCNIIFLNIELFRPEFTGILGNSSLTPNLDRFFSKSIIFHDVTAPAGETFLSNTAVLTVTPAHKINIRPIIIDQFSSQSAEKKLAIEQELRGLTSVAKILNEAGYKTISINQGGRAGKAVFLDRDFVEASQWSSDLLFEDMLEIVKSSLENTKNEKFFLLFRSTYLHNHQSRRPVDSDIPIPTDSRIKTYTYETSGSEKRSGILLKTKRKLTAERKRRAERGIYTGQVIYGDSVIRKLFDSFSEDLLNRTIIVFYANHGTGLGDNEIYNHGTAYQASVNVPLVIRMPGLEQAIHVRQPVELLNLVPSVLKIVGVNAEYPVPVETYDLPISGNIDDDRVFFGRNGFDEYIRYNNWKYIVQYGRFEKLYNLDADPGEKVDLLDQEPGLSRKLAALLLQYKSALIKDALE
ncbi:MAG: sulfatase-like hydrolase/transferase [Gammaproteobacteria bacterium]|nr:sulfatase-like hydrolase/transferase [Gammaproteobacteria bacterium]